VTLRRRRVGAGLKPARVRPVYANPLPSGEGIRERSSSNPLGLASEIPRKIAALPSVARNDGAGRRGVPSPEARLRPGGIPRLPNGSAQGAPLHAPQIGERRHCTEQSDKTISIRARRGVLTEPLHALARSFSQVTAIQQVVPVFPTI